MRKSRTHRFDSRFLAGKPHSEESGRLPRLKKQFHFFIHQYSPCKVLAKSRPR
jgi:hypothetical protein